MRARILASLVAAPIVLASALIGGFWFVAMIHVVVAMGAWEWARLQDRGGGVAFSAFAVAGALAFPLAVGMNQPMVAPFLVVATTAAGIVALTAVTGSAGGLQAGAMALLGGIYLGAALAPGIVVRQAPDGLSWVLVIIIATWACDTAAFFVGRSWGVRTLAPSISPQKTVEGTAAGLAGAFLVAAAAAAAFGGSPARLAGLGLVVGVSAVVGDLLESALKRRLGVKDSGWIIPGHGGILDRIDSLLLSTPCGALYLLAAGPLDLR